MAEELKPEDDRDKPGPIAIAAMTISIVVVGAVLGYMVWQAATLPSDALPEASIARIETGEAGGRLVHVEVSNPSSGGWRHVSVSVDCEDPPPSVELANIPALGRRSAILTCPPGDGNITASVDSFVRT